jgi:hypothetical protein
MAVGVETQPTFNPGKPKILFNGTYSSSVIGVYEHIYWDIHPDSKRFLMLKPATSTAAAPAETVPPPKINIIVNWFEELKRLAPVK